MEERSKKEKNENPKTRMDMMNEQIELLPLPCRSFIYENGTELAISTRLAYARELNAFFEFLVSDKCMPQYDEQNNFMVSFSEKDKSSLTTADIKLIKPSAISQYLTYRKTKGNSEPTLARKRAALSSYFTYMVSNRHLEHNPVSASVKVKIHYSDSVVYINTHDQNKLLADIKSGAKLNKWEKKYHKKYLLRDLTLITLLLDTGMRISELHSINLCDMDFADTKVMITRTGGNKQSIYFSDDVKDLIQEYIQERKNNKEEIKGSSPLFVTKATKNVSPKRLSIRSIEVLVKKYTQSSLPGKGSLSPHKMRSSFAMSFYEMSGNDVLALQQKLGHHSLAATNIYAKANDNTMKETRNLLSKTRKTL
ncbi:MAG: tyrosine-type recombinase/integrase [Mobilitalea sp.]